MILTLTRGCCAILDEEDFDKYSQLKWFASQKGDLFYAVRTQRVGPRKEDKKIQVYLHREIMKALRGQYVDHINGDTLDNRKSNLRICTNAENARNHKGQIKQRMYSVFKGVKKNANCSTYSARITVYGNSLYLGSFKTELEAAVAYNKAAAKYFGQFAYLNEVNV